MHAVRVCVACVCMCMCVCVCVCARTRSRAQLFKAQPEAYLLRVPPLNPSSLLMANPGDAMRILFLTDYRMASQAAEPELIDSGVIFAQRFIRQRFPSAARKYTYVCMHVRMHVYVNMYIIHM